MRRALTERAGFEPARELAPPTRLAGECLQPLGHLSWGRADHRCDPAVVSARYARPRREPAPEIDREALKARYDAIFAAIAPPFAFVDLDAMRRNARRMLAQAGGLPIRVASKSVRSTAVLRRIFELDPGFRGVLAFTAPEALYLAEQGFEDIVVAYPTVDRGGDRAGRPARRRGARARAGADGRRPPPPRPDRGRDRRRAAPRCGSASTSTSAGGRSAAGWRGSGRSARRSTTPAAGRADGGGDRRAARAPSSPG